MVDLSSDGISSASYHAIDEDFIGDIEEDEAVG
jgi:hypothetical protein